MSKKKPKSRHQRYHQRKKDSSTLFLLIMAVSIVAGVIIKITEWLYNLF